MNSLILDSRYTIDVASEQESNDLRCRVYQTIRSELHRLGIPESVCALGVPDAGDDGRICFHDEHGVWVFYIAERGRRSAWAMFQSAFEGVNFLIWYLASDPQKKNGDIGRIGITANQQR